jgi:hypothetical protein
VMIDFHGFLQSLHVNSGTVGLNRPRLSFLRYCPGICLVEIRKSLVIGPRFQPGISRMHYKECYPHY